MAPLHGILTGHRPTFYVYVYAIVTSSNIAIAANTITDSKFHPDMRHLSDTETIIGISSFVQLLFRILFHLSFPIQSKFKKNLF